MTTPDATPRFLKPPQQEALKKIIKEYIGRARGEVAAADWTKIEKAGLGKIAFAWLGGLETGEGHYYRVQGPTFLSIPGQSDP